MVPFSQAAGYSPKHPAVLAANPKGQVPVLIDGDLTLFDSTLIFEYLEDAYPLPSLYPAGAAARARCRRLELTADEILLPLVVRLMHRTTPPDPEPAKEPERRPAPAKPRPFPLPGGAALERVGASRRQRAQRPRPLTRTVRGGRTRIADQTGRGYAAALSWLGETLPTWEAAYDTV